MVMENPNRVIQMMEHVIEKLEHDLSDLTVLMEAASGHFMCKLLLVTRGSAGVIALTLKPKYVCAEEVASHTWYALDFKNLAKQMKILFIQRLGKVMR
jgi:hypothetical protein